jgi:hypothetical protein
LADPTVALVGEILTLMPLPGEIVMCTCSFAEAPRESEAFTHKYFDTAAVGVPVTAPVVPLRVRPLGSAPSITRNEYGETPPVTENDPEYAIPTVPDGRLADIMMPDC